MSGSSSSPRKTVTVSPKLKGKILIVGKLAGSAAKQAAKRLHAKIEEAQKPIELEPTPRWRDLGFNGILAAALKAGPPAPPVVPKRNTKAEHSGVADESGDADDSSKKAADEERIAAEEALHRARQKRGMLQRKVAAAEQRELETAKEVEKLQGTVDKLEGEVKDVVGKRFAVEIKANDLECRVQETQAQHETLLHQSSLDYQAFSRASELQKRMIENVAGKRPTSANQYGRRKGGADNHGGQKRTADEARTDRAKTSFKWFIPCASIA